MKDETTVKIELSYKKHKALYLLGCFLTVVCFIGIMILNDAYVAYAAVGTFIGLIFQFLAKFLDWWDRGSVQ